jgi:transcription elongation factor Elf1
MAEPMSPSANSDAGFEKHEFLCPHCQHQTPHFWPGSTVLFATAKCEHCSQEFLIVENTPRK